MRDQTLRLQQINTSFSLDSIRALLIMLGVLALLGVIYLTQSSQATMTGQRAQDLQTRLDRLKRENAQLEYEIAVLTTPSKIAERARALGLHPATTAQTVFVTVKDYPISAPKPAPATVDLTVSSPDSLTTLWNELLLRLGLAPIGRTVEATTN